MHLYFYGFSDETIHVAGFCGKEFGFLQSDNVVLIEAVFSYCRFVRLGQSVMSPMLFYPKRRQLELRRRGITQKGTNYSLSMV